MRNLLTLMDYPTETIEKLLRDANAIKNTKEFKGEFVIVVEGNKTIIEYKNLTT